jgi:predicted O-methyltransferase YrrM
LLLETYISTLFEDPQMLRMGHAQSKDDLNLGLGWIYYALARALRPQSAVAIGSYRGFVPSVIARALLDNAEPGLVTFIDPSLADDFWIDPSRVSDHFEKLGTPNVVHYRHTTQSFVETQAYAALNNVGLLMIDGYHTAEQARLDYLSFLPKLSEQAVTLFHDSVSIRNSTFYGEDRAYRHTVRMFMARLESTPGLEVFTLPLGSGVSLVRGQPKSLDLLTQPF